MFADVHLVSAWFGFIAVMLLFRVPFLIAVNRSQARPHGHGHLAAWEHARRVRQR